VKIGTHLYVPVTRRKLSRRRLGYPASVLGMVLLAVLCVGRQLVIMKGIGEIMGKYGQATHLSSMMKQVPVFYNLYIPEGDVDRVKALANMQLAPLLSHHSLLYVSIGVHPNASFFELPRQPMHLGHYEQGDERVTQDVLWQFCQNNTDAKVVYLHAKGSFRKYCTVAILR
jgi:hypothetical protein